ADAPLSLPRAPRRGGFALPRDTARSSGGTPLLAHPQTGPRACRPRQPGGWLWPRRLDEDLRADGCSLPLKPDRRWRRVCETASSLPAADGDSRAGHWPRPPENTRDGWLR